MNHNWHIGQDIVCINTHSGGIVKEGELFTIKGLRESFCSCDNVEINIGFSSSCSIERCLPCNTIVGKTDDIFWFSESLFAPIDTLTDISEIEEILSNHYLKYNYEYTTTTPRSQSLTKGVHGFKDKHRH